jgi:hypothetical protein
MGDGDDRPRETAMIVLALIGAKALYFLFLWLLSAAAAAWLADRKGYGERVGLTFGLILSAIGLLIVLLLPGRPGSRWREEGWLPKRRPRAGQDLNS